MTQSQNEVLLEGLVWTEPQWSHENHGTQFYLFHLQIPRLSEAADLLPIVIPQSDCSQVIVGKQLRLQGQLRSFNNHSGIGNRLILTVYAQQFLPPTQEFCNQILLSGVLCKAPILRKTPLGRSICDLMLAVPRRYGRSDYLPIIAWGQLAAQASHLATGAELALEGRIQSRTYHKVTDCGVEERIAYEVSMMHLRPNISEEA